ncbi:uncharacterized protein LOC133785060 [Humulus lupulus]|uniref:uncharacterized protein LOC133785060 n=1 Tax=Humulus lupulus TaxID=3486 RepID=UPI002B407318|nr:uncharacterized protein LOC133785060 [Humulus lupulus]
MDLRSPTGQHVRRREERQTSGHRGQLEIGWASGSSLGREGVHDMASEDMFDMYTAPEAPDAPASKKKASRQHHVECSKAPPAKKTRIADPPEARPSTNTTPPPSPLEQQTLPTPVGPAPSPPTPADQTQLAALAPTGDDLSSRALRSAKDRMARILRHERCREAMAGTESMDVDQILNCALNELVSLEAAQKANATLLEEKNTLAEEVKGKQTALDKAIEAKEKYKESHVINYREAKKLEADLIVSRQEAEKLEARIDELEKANASNLESYLPERMRKTEIARCVARLAEEEKAKIPASPKISLATSVEGVDDEADAAADQENPQDPPAL